jgi:hypothetical protein
MKRLALGVAVCVTMGAVLGSAHGPAIDRVCGDG